MTKIAKIGLGVGFAIVALSILTCLTIIFRRRRREVKTSAVRAESLRQRLEKQASTVSEITPMTMSTPEPSRTPPQYVDDRMNGSEGELYREGPAAGEREQNWFAPATENEDQASFITALLGRPIQDETSRPTYQAYQSPAGPEPTLGGPDHIQQSTIPPWEGLVSPEERVLSPAEELAAARLRSNVSPLTEGDRIGLTYSESIISGRSARSQTTYEI